MFGNEMGSSSSSFAFIQHVIHTIVTRISLFQLVCYIELKCTNATYLRYPYLYRKLQNIPGRSFGEIAEFT